MWNIGNKMLSGAAAAIVLIAGAAAQDAPQEPQKVIMVLDGSGSMWGQIDGVAKIDIARNVIGDMLNDWNAGVELGVMAYGHRAKGDCNDIETLTEVGPVDKAAVITKVNAINPKGKTPISAAVRKAAEALKYTEEKATVILVSDGLETCNADPCALADELEAAGVDFTAHVIGFDITEDEQASLACLANNTGGRFMRASNATELTTALAETVETVAQAQPDPEPVNEGPQGVRLRAKLCETCDIIEDNMFWRVLETEQDLEGNRKQAAIDSAAAAIIELPARDYLVRARYGNAFAETTVTVEPGKLTDTVVNMNAGHLRINTVMAENGAPLEKGMFYRVLSSTTNLEGERKQIAIDSNAKPIFRLPAGDYILRSKHGAAVVDTPITIKAGETLDKTITQNSGRVKLNAVQTPGGAPLTSGVFWRIYQPTGDLEKTEKQIAIDSNASPIFALPEGEYVVAVRYGGEISRANLTVTAGEEKKVEIVLN